VALQQVLEQMLENDMAGDPMSEQRWVRCSGAQLAAKLKEAGYSVCPTTVYRLLKRMGFSLKSNKKKISSKSRDSEQNEQFQYIASQREAFRDAGLPLLSVDGEH
jgi:transposase